MDEEAVVHIHDRLWLSYEKESIWVCSNEVYKTEANYTEWSKSERERQIMYINTYIYIEFRKMVLTILQAEQQKTQT